MRKRIAVFVTSCELGEGAWTDQEVELKRLYSLSDKRFDLVQDPTLADIIIVGNSREENRGYRILRQPLINEWPDKCFSMSDQDHPLILHHGIYASTSRSWLSLNRVRTGGYTLYSQIYANQYIACHRPPEADYCNKKYLMSFIGRVKNRVRADILGLQFRRQDILVEDSSQVFNIWTPALGRDRLDRQQYYL